MNDGYIKFIARLNTEALANLDGGQASKRSGGRGVSRGAALRLCPDCCGEVVRLSFVLCVFEFFSWVLGGLLITMTF